MRSRIRAALLLLVVSGSASAAERIVTLAPNLAELVCAVHACGDLVGVAQYSDFPAEVAQLPQVGNAMAVNLEAVLALQPTRVLAWDSGTPATTIARLRGLGLPVESIVIQNLDQVATALQQLGAELGHGADGEAAADGYRKRLAGLRARYADRPRLRAFYQIETGPAYTVNGDSPISAALDLCGADNVFSSLPTVSAIVSAEAVLAADPDVVVYANDEDARGMAAYWARLSPARAADPKRQVQVDPNALTRPSPRVLDGIAELCTGLDRVRRDAK